MVYNYFYHLIRKGNRIRDCDVRLAQGRGAATTLEFEDFEDVERQIMEEFLSQLEIQVERD